MMATVSSLGGTPAEAELPQRQLDEGGEVRLARGAEERPLTPHVQLERQASVSQHLG